ncbi:MAG: hypothetical protein CG439_2919, partial [Methylococcaceae bacterium NSP1-2]
MRSKLSTVASNDAYEQKAVIQRPPLIDSQRPIAVARNELLNCVANHSS